MILPRGSVPPSSSLLLTIKSMAAIPGPDAAAVIHSKLVGAMGHMQLVSVSVTIWTSDACRTDSAGIVHRWYVAAQGKVI